MGYRFKIVLLVLVALVALGTNVDAQVTYSRLKGVARNESRAGVPGATITVLYSETRVHMEALTDADGAFIFSALPPGQFTLTVEAKS